MTLSKIEKEHCKALGITETELETNEIILFIFVFFILTN